MSTPESAIGIPPNCQNRVFLHQETLISTKNKVESLEKNNADDHDEFRDIHKQLFAFQRTLEDKIFNEVAKRPREIDADRIADQSKWVGLLWGTLGTLIFSVIFGGIIVKLFFVK
jgi:hypothetical protein